MAEPKKRSTPKRIKAPLPPRSGFEFHMPEESRKFWDAWQKRRDAWQKRMEGFYPTPKPPKPRTPPPRMKPGPDPMPRLMPQDAIQLLKGPKGGGQRRGKIESAPREWYRTKKTPKLRRTRSEDPSAKRLGTYQSSPRQKRGPSK